jgi:hypothetical protein
MVNKSEATGEAAKEGRIKVGKLQLNKETVVDLTKDDLKDVKGGLVVITIIGVIIGPLEPASTRCPPPPVKK